MSGPRLRGSAVRHSWGVELGSVSNRGIFVGHRDIARARAIETRRDLVEKKPDLVQRFVDASIEGWYSYLDGDPAPGDALIKKDNPDMTDALLRYGRAALKRNGVLESGDARMRGIGEQLSWQDDLPPLALLLVNPNRPLATAAVFADLGPLPAPPPERGPPPADWPGLVAWPRSRANHLDEPARTATISASASRS